MSIVTLKRKTQAQYNNNSVNSVTGFSLNGTTRNQGFVGQTSLSRTLVRSLAKGPHLRGHGQCCGQYPITNIKTSPDMACLNNPAVVKSPVMNTRGLFMTKYRWIRRPQPFTTVKLDANRNKNNQGLYIEYVEKTALACDVKKTVIIDHCKKCTLPGEPSTKNYQTASSQNTVITKPMDFTGALNASDQIRKVQNTCVKWDSFKFSNNLRRIPFGCGVV
jgi:hypothetical protein